MQIKATIQAGNGAMVHCMASISRSAVFIIAYLMEAEGWSAAEATKVLKKKWWVTVQHPRLRSPLGCSTSMLDGGTTYTTSVLLPLHS